MNKILSTALMLFALASPVSAGILTDNFTSFYSFGDSLTDDGKLGPLLQEPSLDGRFSNGITYAEYIEDLFIGAGLDTANLALGGATAGNVNTLPIPEPLNTFGGQVATFNNAVENNVGLPTKLIPPEFKPTGPNPGANPLVSVLFGANDIFQGITSPTDAADFVADGIRSIGEIDGYNFDDFFVPNLPLGLDPDFTIAAILFNTQLAENIVDLRAEGFNIVEFNTQAVFEEIVADILAGGPEYGILEIFPPCRPQGLTNPEGDSCVDLGIDPNTIFLNDSVHPNGKVHEVWGGSAIATLEASVPTVGTLPLILSVLIAFGITRQRRLR